MAKPKKSTIAFCITLFIVGTILMFPLQNVRGYVFDKILTQTGILIVAEDIYPLVFGWPGIGIKKVNVSLPAGRNDIELSGDKLYFRTRLMWPFVPAVSMQFSELKGGGDLFIKAGKRGNTMKLGLEADALNLEQVSLPGLNKGIPGLINADVKISANEADFAKTSGSIRITGSKLRMPNHMVSEPMLGTFQIPALEIGDVDIRMEIANGGMEIPSFKLGGPSSDLSATITGNAQLGRDYLSTVLNLVVRLKIAEKIMSNPDNRTFLDFLGAYRTPVAGEFGFKWNASIREILSLSKALPMPL